MSNFKRGTGFKHPPCQGEADITRLSRRGFMGAAVAAGGTLVFAGAAQGVPGSKNAIPSTSVSEEERILRRYGSELGQQTQVG